MQNQTVQSTTGEPLDVSVVALAKAIRSTESDNNYNAHGQSGEFGAYQWMPTSWSSNANKYLGDSNAPMTPVNQDKVAYNTILNYKNQGYSPEEIASLWNSGKPNWIGNVGVNSSGVKYDTPTYVNNVVQAYTQNKDEYFNSQQNTQDISGSPEQPSVGGFIENATGSVGNVLGGLGNAIMHPVKTVENIASTAAGASEALTNTLGLTKFNNQDTQNFGNLLDVYKKKYGGSSIGEVVNNIAHTAYTDPAGMALDLSVLLDGIGGALGAAGKVSDAAKISEFADLAKTGTPEAVAELTKPGTLSQIGSAMKTASNYTNPLAPVGKVIESVGEGTSKLGTNLVKNTVPGIKYDETANWIADNIGWARKSTTMLQQAEDLAASYSDAIGEQLRGVKQTTSLNETLAEIPKLTYPDGTPKYPNAIFNKNEVITDVKNALGAKNASLADRLESGEITLEDANKIRSALGKYVFKKGIDVHTVKLTQEDLAIVQEALRQIIADKAPAVQPLFKNLSSATNASKGLRRLVEAKHSGLVHNSDFLSLGLGYMSGGAPGALALEGLSKVQSSPQARLAEAKLLKKVSPGIKAVGKVIPKAKYVVEANQANQ